MYSLIDASSQTPTDVCMRGHAARLWRLAAGVALSAVGMLAAPALALADDNGIDITTTLTPVPDTVTLSTANLPTFLSYQVTLTHYPVRTETLKPVFFDASTSVLDATGAAVPNVTAQIIGSDSAECTASGPSVHCVFSAGLSAPGEVKSFSITVRAPTDGAKVSLTSTTSWKESANYGFETESEVSRTAVTLLSAPDPAKVESYVPVSTQDTTLFTGLGCVPSPLFAGCAATSTQTWTTTVKIPASTQATTAQILQSIVAGGCASNLLTCSTSVLTIPGSFDHLEITLRRDASTIANNGAKIGSAIILYSDPAHPDARIKYPLQVPDCTDTTYGNLPQPGIPCIKLRTDYPKKSTPKITVPPDFAGDWEFVIWALDNGKYAN